MIRWIEIWYKESLIIANFEILLKFVYWETEHEKIISFNLSAVFLVEENKDVYEKVIFNTEIVFGNEDESSAFGKTHGVECRFNVAEHISVAYS